MSIPVRLLWLLLWLAVPPIDVLAGAPDWLIEWTKRPAPNVTKEAPAVVLLDETVQTIDKSGMFRSVHRVAIKILTRSGIDNASAKLEYIDKQDSIRSANAWLVRGSKTVKTLPSGEWLDLSSFERSTLMSDSRTRSVDLSREAEPGDFFGYETRIERIPMTADVLQSFGWELPVILERYQLQVPAGFTIKSIVTGPARLTNRTSADGCLHTWDLTERPYKTSEAWVAAGDIDEPQLLVSVSPASNGKKFRPKVFRDWKDVAVWSCQLNEPQCNSDASLQATVKMLIEAHPDRLGQIRALATHVQNLRYVAIALDLGRGGGFRPRQATEVHAKGWGDCKDKANLLCSMLREIGVQAYPVSVLLSDGYNVHQDWPSPVQFNHAIVAIAVDETVTLPPIVKTQQWGRLLFFDPTAENVPFGSFPWALQGTCGLIEAPDSVELVDLPQLPEDRQWLVERKVQIVLDRMGAVTGEGEEKRMAQSGSAMRAIYGKLSQKEVLTVIAERLSNTLRSVSVKEATRLDDPAHDYYQLAYKFSAPEFIQRLRESLAVVRLDILNRDSIPLFSENERRTPVGLFPYSFTDEVVVELPEGMEVAECPPPTAMNGPYGSHEKSVTTQQGKVVYRRKFVLKNRVVPVAEYNALKQFLADVAKADRAAVVLRLAQ